MLTYMMTAAGESSGLGGPAEIWASIVRDFSNIGEPGALAAFFQVLMIDLVLAGDNAIVVGALAAGLPAEQRRRVIMIGVIAALVLRVGFALVVTQLLQIVGLILAGASSCYGWPGECGGSCATAARALDPRRSKVTSIRASIRPKVSPRQRGQSPWRTSA